MMPCSFKPLGLHFRRGYLLVGQFYASQETKAKRDVGVLLTHFYIIPDTTNDPESSRELAIEFFCTQLKAIAL